MAGVTQASSQLVWCAPIYEATGYADEARGLLTALEQRGVGVTLRPVRERQVAGFREQLPESVRHALMQQEARAVHPPYVLVQHFPADGFVDAPGAFRAVGRTMFETDGLPPSWVAQCNRMHAIWVPSTFNRETFRAAGVQVPLVVIPGGIDAKWFSPDGPQFPLPNARRCVFLSIFEWRIRKGWDLLLRAWAEAFSPADDVTLVIRSYVPGSSGTERDVDARINRYLATVLGKTRDDVAPIEVLHSPIAPNDLPALYRAATAYVSPTRGEGWSRPFMEAMACQLPVIATRWSAHLDYMNDGNSLLVDIDGLVPAEDPAIPAYAGSRWASPSLPHLVQQLRQVYEQPSQARAVGAQARDDMQRLWSWDAAARKVQAAVETLLDPPALPRDRGQPASFTAEVTAEATSHPCRLRPFAPPTAAAAPRLCFAMLTYNALAYTKRCVASLDRWTDEPWRLTILDNGSTDGTRAWLATLQDPRVNVILSETNLGVAGGRNALVEAVRDRVPPDGFIVFVDNDLEFHPQWLAPFREVESRSDRVGMMSCSGFEIVAHAQHRELLSYPGLLPMEVDVASGGYACFVRPAVFEAIGGYDEALGPFWHEDDDITVRARAAGWRTFACPNLAVIHHGHKSGAAIPALVHGGSRSKQAYLVGKWRAAGWVLPDGRLSPGRQVPSGAHGGGTMPGTPDRMRSEVERARMDAMQVSRALADGDMPRATAFASAAALGWTTATSQSASPAEHVPNPVTSFLTSLRDTRRRQSRLPSRTPDPEADVPLMKLADVADWEAKAWYNCAVDDAGDGRGRLQWYDRRARTWDTVQAIRAFAQHERFRRAKRTLVLGDLRSPGIWSLASRCEELIVGDFLERHGVPSGTQRLADPSRFALRDVPPDRVTVLAFEALPQLIAPASLDAVAILPWNEHGAVTDVGALLTLIRPLLAPRGVVWASAPVRLAGPPDRRVLDGTARVGPWLASLGFESLLTPDLEYSDDGLLSAAEAASLGQRSPDLLVRDGALLWGRLSLLLALKGEST